jgi:catechol-2,3-dioxygenase
MKLLEVELLSADILQTKEFYHEILGMEILHADDSSIKVSAGLSTLIFKKTNNENPFYHFAFTIPSNKFEEAHAWASKGVQLLPVTPDSTIADFKNWNAKAFYFYDNNQNIVEFIARFDLDNNSDKPFDGSSVFSISEIGIVVDNAKAHSEKMLEEYELNFFSRQPPQDDFVAIGDDHGLFIVVNDKRNWYPTNKPSGKYWTAIKMEYNGKITDIEIPGE